MLWYVLPLALATALSLFPVLAVVLLLLSPRPVPASLAYLAGWSLGVLLLVTVFAAGARLIPPSHPHQMPNWAHTVELLIGVALIVVGVRGVARVRAGTEVERTPAWARAMNSMGPRGAFVFGVAMNARPKNITVALAAGLAIGSASLDLVGNAFAVFIFTGVSVSTVAALVLAYLFGRRRMRPRLRMLSEWLVAHTGLVIELSLVLLGLILAGVGAANLIW